MDCQELEVNVLEAVKEGVATIEPLAPAVLSLLLSGNLVRNEVRNPSLDQAKQSALAQFESRFVKSVELGHPSYADRPLIDAVSVNAF